MLFSSDALSLPSSAANRRLPLMCEAVDLATSSGCPDLAISVHSSTCLKRGGLSW